MALRRSQLRRDGSEAGESRVKDWPMYGRDLCRQEILTAKAHDRYREDWRVDPVLRDLLPKDECASCLPGNGRGPGDESTTAKAWFGVGVGRSESVSQRSP